MIINEEDKKIFLELSNIDTSPEDFEIWSSYISIVFRYEYLLEKYIIDSQLGDPIEMQFSKDFYTIESKNVEFLKIYLKAKYLDVLTDSEEDIESREMFLSQFNKIQEVFDFKKINILKYKEWFKENYGVPE